MSRSKALAGLCISLMAGCALTLAVASAQDPLERPSTRPPGDLGQTRLPNGKLQSDEILKLDHQANLKDLQQIQKLVDEIKTEMEKNDRFVVSVSHMKKLEEVEKASQRIRGRMRRW